MDTIDLSEASATTAGSGQAVWTNSMTTMMLGFLANLVADGKRTSSGFKMMHHNQCAAALNEHFKLVITGSQDHKSDVAFLNTPIEHYRAMETIFMQKTATGKNARSGNDDLSIEIEDDDNGEVNMSPNVGESSNPNEPAKKKAKVVKNKDDLLMTTLQDGFKLVAAALVKSAGDDDTIPDDLWEVVSGTIGFAEGYLAHYYAHLVDNPKLARAFMSLSDSNRLI
ncbi:putative nuclease HARBI1 [Hordeum vulgare]|nr:putative nuclease HARBI1 [Hordeum vulgare]